METKTVAQLEAEFAAAIEKLAGDLNGLFAEKQTQIDELKKRVEVLEGKAAPTPVATPTEHKSQLMRALDRLDKATGLKKS